MIDRTTSGDGALYWRELPDEMEIVVYKMLYNTRLSVGDGMCLIDGYCYASPARAMEAAAVWDGEGDPLDGWHKNIRSGRRRPDGDPKQEYVEF